MTTTTNQYADAEAYGHERGEAAPLTTSEDDIYAQVRADAEKEGFGSVGAILAAVEASVTLRVRKMGTPARALEDLQGEGRNDG